jgi:hypothetical protein
MNGPIDPRAPAWAIWMHHHPIANSIIFTVVIVTIIVMIRWLMNQSAWIYHPGGANGFLKDEFVRLGAIFVPWLFLASFAKYYIYDLHPELNTPQTWAIFGVCAIGTRLLLRRLPAVKAMGRHIDDAKAKARAAKSGVPQ